jgi:Ca2+-binding EF-hand superfamily protein
LLSTINLRQMLNKDKLRAVFKMFDVEGAGAVTMDQMRVGLRLNGAS